MIKIMKAIRVFFVITVIIFQTGCIKNVQVGLYDRDNNLLSRKYDDEFSLSKVSW